MFFLEVRRVSSQMARVRRRFIRKSGYKVVEENLIKSRRVKKASFPSAKDRKRPGGSFERKSSNHGGNFNIITRNTTRVRVLLTILISTRDYVDRRAGKGTRRILARCHGEGNSEITVLMEIKTAPQQILARGDLRNSEV